MSMRIPGLVPSAMLTLALLGCGGGGDVGAPPAPATPPAPPASSPTTTTLNVPLTGTIRNQAELPVAGALVGVWVQTDRMGYWAGSVRSDAQGRYTMSGIPAGATVMLQLSLDAHVQACVTQQAVMAGGEIHGLLHTVSYLRAGGGPPADAGSVISGRVRSAATGLPVAEASVYVDLMFGMGLIGANTVTDEQGRYWTCRVPAVPGFVVFQATAEGFFMQETAPVDASSSATLDFALSPR